MLNPYRGFLLSRVRIPPSPQGAADIRAVDTTEHAWAAGFFDAEGSVLIRDQRGYARRELAVSQGGAEMAPPVLLRLQRTFDGRGSVRGPRRGYLYYWRASNAQDVDAIGTLLLPWLSDPKRSQLIAAADRAHADLAQDGDMEGIRHEEHEGAWAAGFFGGDGTVSASRSVRASPARCLRARIAQGGATGEPEARRRFKAPVGDLGSIRGPFMPKNPWSRQPQHAWQVGGSADVEAVLERRWPWLDEAKRDQARRAIVCARGAGPHRPMPLANRIFGLG